jgi:hypothetical protein
MVDKFMLQGAIQIDTNELMILHISILQIIVLCIISY